jgi:hypothetical protein
VNSVVIIMLVLAGGAAAYQLMRKRNPLVAWLARYWAGQETIPAQLTASSDHSMRLVHVGLDAHWMDPRVLRVVTVPNTEVYAARHGIVSWIGTVAEYGPCIVVSHLFRDEEATCYAGLSSMAGLGAFVMAGEPIGTMLTSQRLAFIVFDSRAPDPTTATTEIEAAAWLEGRNIIVSAMEEE